MNDIIQWASLSDLTPTITNLAWPDPSYIYLERVPGSWLDDSQRKNGICLEKFDPTTSFTNWERGRVFCETFELRWEKQDAVFQTVYVGPPIALLGFTLATELDLNGKQARQPRYYYLWGNRVPANQLADVGETKKPGSEVFIEFQVPRVLRYPVSTQANRVKLKVCEYFEPFSGTLIHSRFQGLEEEQ